MNGYSEEVCKDLFAGLDMLKNDATIMEVSVRVSDHEHYMSMRRKSPNEILMGQIRVDPSKTQWLERPAGPNAIVKEKYSPYFSIILQEVLQPRTLQDGQASVAERIQDGDPLILEQVRSKQTHIVIYF